MIHDMQYQCHCYRPLVAPDVKAGDRILFGKYSGSEVKLEDEEHLILREDDILGVLEG
jgi:chaperonin GroES